MVNIFIDLPALNRLQEFGGIYVEMINAWQAGSLEKAWGLQQQVATRALAVQRDLERVGLGRAWLSEAPILGGRTRPADMALVMANLKLAQEYNFDPQMILTNLQMAIGEYQRRVKRGVLALFCPVWWLELVLRCLFRIPVGLVGMAGYNAVSFERSGPGKALQFIWSAIIVVLTVGAALMSAAAGMQQVGWWEPFLQQLSSFRP
jgi:hypothetical protein